MKHGARSSLKVAVFLGITLALSAGGIYYASAALTVTSSPIDLTPTVYQRSRSIVDYVGSLDLTADPAYHVQLKSITITFAGSALSNGTPAFSVSLKSLTGTTAQTCTPSGNSCTVTFTPTYAVSAGKTKTIKIRIDSSNFHDEQGVFETLSVTINSASDLLWNDGVIDDIPLEPTNIPLVIASVLYI